MARAMVAPENREKDAHSSKEECQDRELESFRDELADGHDFVCRSHGVLLTNRLNCLHNIT
jgi:hypothetical protein